MAKSVLKKKKTNRRLKRSVRRTLGALCMMTAIIVAAIPFPDAEAEEASNSDIMTVDDGAAVVAEYQYNPSSAVDLVIKDVISGVEYKTSDEKTGQYTAYTISQGSGGRWELDWQFKYYAANKGSDGIITDYNGAYSRNVVELERTVYFDYVYITQDDYADFLNTTDARNVEVEIHNYIVNDVNKKVQVPSFGYVYKIDQDPNLMDLNDPSRDFYETKIPKESALYAQYAKFKEDYAKYTEAGGETQTPPEGEEPIKKPNAIQGRYSDIYTTDAQRQQFLCDEIFGGGTTMKIVPVTFRQYDASGNPMDANPLDVYVPQVEQRPDTGQVGLGADLYNVDKNNFLARNVGFIGGIAKGAFAEVENVDTLTIADEIDFIGDSAFQDSFIRAVNLPLGAKIGNRAFKGCKYLTEVNMTKGIQKIGTECFSECPVLTSIEIPTSVETIGMAAFYKCDRLANVVVSDSANMEIQDYAFFDCPALSNVEFGTSNISKIGKAAFALTVAETGSLSEFQMPNSLSGTDCIGDYLFAGRTAQLKKVIMPINLGRAASVTLPGNMFDGCNSLQCVEFPSDSCFYVEYPSNLFEDVRYNGFYVRGPKVDPNNNPAMPRQKTWVATFNNGVHVPYVYNENGQDYYEVSDGTYLMVIDEQGILTSCQFIKGKEADIPEFVIPANVGEITVKEIANGCFDTSSSAATGILDRIIKLKIEDGQITKINDNVFHNADKLKEVIIGNSVQDIGIDAFSDSPLLEKVSIGSGVSKIGDSAFENCTSLTEIAFATPAGGVTSFPLENIGQNAFSTNSEQMTIYGAIDGSYGPFAWAMQADNYMKPATGLRVCYKSAKDDPQGLTVILDNSNNMPTLLDYPKLKDADIQEILADTSDITPEENAKLNAVYNITVPNGVRSVDAKGYFSNSSKILDGTTPAYTSNDTNIEAYFKDSIKSENGGGLFTSDSAVYGAKLDNEYTDGSDEQLLYEKEDKGNDRIESVTLTSVEYLPDYCFDSCERLVNVNLGSAMQDLGILPFKGCESITSIACGNDNFSCNNGLLCENLDDGTKKLVECLPGRGNAVGTGLISTAADADLANVSEIAEGAFSNCPYIQQVDFNGATALEEIPKECFKGSKKLTKIIMPENVVEVGDEAFADTGSYTEAWIYSKEASIGDNIMDGITEAAYLYTWPNTATSRQANNEADKNPNITVFDIPAEGTYIVNFFVESKDADGNITYVNFYQHVADKTGKDYADLQVVVEAGASAKKLAPTAEELKEYNFIPEGYEFARWMGQVAIDNITESCDFYAVFTPTGADSDGDGIPDDKDPDADGDGVPDDQQPGGNTPGGNTPGGTTPGTTPDDNKGDDDDDDKSKKYTLTVVYGDGSGVYKSGTKVIISAIEPPAGKEFYKWESNNSGVTITSATSAATTVKTTSSDATVTATYRNKSTVSGNSTNTVNRKPIGSSSTSVQISKPGISNTDKAYASVSGSTDNFIVKITESSAAANAVATALSNKYGDMNPIKYFAMDISLYDKNGNKVTNTNGLSVNITMPIPDALVQYGGNNRVGAVVNGNALEDLGCKFTTVDGIPCVTFTATHFSPYTIYVDTSNLSVNTLDSTPKTGDGIHPKWFVSIALACISLILFMKKDKVIAPKKVTV